MDPCLRRDDDAELQCRQDLAQAAMRRGARLNDMRAMTEGERRLVGEVRERSRRQGLDPDAARAAEADALGVAHSDVVEDLAHHDPQQAQGWLNAQAGTIGDPAKVERLNRMLRPYVAEQQQVGLADLIRGEAGALPAQHAAVDAMGLDPEIAEELKQRLAGMAEGDRRAAEKEQDAAFTRVVTAVRDPATRSLRSLSPSDYDMLSPERQEAVRAIVAANLRGDGPATNPNFYASFANKLPQGAHADDEIPRAFESSPHPQAALFGPTSGNAVSAGSEDQPFDDSLFLSSDKNSDIHVGNTDPINTIYDPDAGKPIFERTSLLGDVRRKWNESWTAAAKKSVSKVISDPKTSRPAKEILESFLSGKGRREFYYGPKSEGLKELFSGDTGGYFQREQIEAMRYMAYDKEKRGYLKDGDELDKYVFRDFNLADGVSGFRDGTQIGDVVGTLTRRITAHVKGGRVYFKAENYVTMLSFAGGNLIPVQARLIDLPKSGPLSSVKTIFEWSAPIPDYLKEKH